MECVRTKVMKNKISDGSPLRFRCPRRWLAISIWDFQIDYHTTLCSGAKKIKALQLQSFEYKQLM